MDLLRAPARAYPTSLAGQLRYVRDFWGTILGDRLTALLDRMLLTLDVIAEEEHGLHLRFGGGGAGDGGGRPDVADLTGLDIKSQSDIFAVLRGLTDRGVTLVIAPP